jgi:iron complex transport system permease protein
MVGSVTVQKDGVLMASKLLRTRMLSVLPLLALFAGGAALIALHVGYRRINVLELWRDPEARGIFLQLRLPRVLLAGIVGASLSAVGAALQALFRNALAEPFTLGVSGGASLGASAAIALGLGSTLAGLPAVFMLAFAGAALSMSAVYYIARSGHVVVPGNLLLSGIVMNLCATAGVMLVQYLSNFNRAMQILRWTIGSLDVVGYGLIWRMLIGLIPGWLLLLVHSRDLNLMALGDESAAALGVDVRRVERRIYLASALIVGITAAAGGNIGFVGLVVPHAARLLFGQDFRLLLPASFLLGSAFLMLADMAARSLLSPSEMPVGILTALLGGPLFLWLLRRERRIAGF